MKLDVVQVQQWLTDISATRAQDGLDDGLKKAEEHKDSFLAGLSKFRDMYTNENDKEGLNKLGEIEQTFKDYYEAGKKMAQAYIDGGPAEGNKQMEAFDKAAESLTDNLVPFVNQQTAELHTDMSAIVSSIDSLTMLNLITGIVTVVIGACMAVFMPLKITTLFRNLITRLTDSALQVVAASEQISASSQKLSEATTEQAATIEETSSTMEEISSMTAQNSENAAEAAKLAKACNGAVEHGNSTVIEMDHSMKDIAESSKKIADIIKIIEGIAFQTNLLALNAAVEAARAGEHGRGFAVVAEEVRNLAQRSSAAAKDITSLITDSVKKAETGTELVKKTKEVFTGVVTQVKKVTDLVNEIATASEEQANGIEQITKAIQQMDQATQQNAATAEETAASSEEMSTLAHELNTIVKIIGAEVGIKSNGASAESDTVALRKGVTRLKRMETDIPNNKNEYKDSDNFTHDKREEIPCEGYEKEPVIV